MLKTATNCHSSANCQSASVNSRNCKKVTGYLNVLIQPYQTTSSWHPINFKKIQCNPYNLRKIKVILTQAMC